MELFDPKLDQYVDQHSEKEPDVLYQLYRETHQKVLNARMVSGHLQGRVFSMLSHMIRPKYVLELGTFTGYSAICWTEGMSDDGELHTIDRNEELHDLAAKYFEKAGVDHKIHQHTGNAMDIIPTLEKPWDIVFIDADKKNYCNYFDLLIDRVPSGCYIITDNVLWYGKVVEPVDEKDADTQEIIRFNQKMQDDDRVQNVLFPIRDGFMICRKK
tara:strand:+ start:4294 stop:4935 length:642 start_codon:yes stop_codon:yes gene_type:complete